MLEYKLLLLFGVCAAFILLSGLVIVIFYRGAEKAVGPIITITLLPEMENLEFIVRNCVYPLAEKCPEAMAAAIDLGADSETIHIFERLMEHSCRYEIIDSEECSENICKIMKDML